MLDMKRREFIAALAGTAVWPFSAHGQQSKPNVLGYLWIGPQGSDGLTLRGIQQGLKDVGLVDGRDIRIEARYADGHPERLTEIAQELVRLKPTVLLAPGAVATRAARSVTATIPIISVSNDPVALGFAESLARPGGNITGMTIVASDRLVEKWLELLHETVPGLGRAGLLFNTSNPYSPKMVNVALQAGAATGVEIVPVGVEDASDIVVALSKADLVVLDGFIVADDAFLLSMRAQILAFVTHRRIPAVYGQREYTDVGGLMSYATNIGRVWRRASAYIDKILKGSKPSDLPIEQPTTFELIINLKTAKSIGLTVPATLLTRADEVIE